jgi:biopolymer transport protein ExbB
VAIQLLLNYADNDWLLLFQELASLGHIKQLFEAGGVVLEVLAVLAFALSCLLFSRLWFRLFEYPKMLQKCLVSDSPRQFIMVHYQVSKSLQQSMSLTKTAINICPLLGLIGTVVGMIDIFDVIALSGVSNAQSMAAGVARAILPTMAGMVVAISGMFVFAYIQRWVVKQQLLLKRLSLSWSEY